MARRSEPLPSHREGGPCGWNAATSERNCRHHRIGQCTRGDKTEWLHGADCSAPAHLWAPHTHHRIGHEEWAGHDFRLSRRSQGGFNWSRMGPTTFTCTVEHRFTWIVSLKVPSPPTSRLSSPPGSSCWSIYRSQRRLGLRYHCPC